LIGGLITAATGIIAKKYGPAIGGLFLAFPAILPASATLIEKHEREKKERVRLNGVVRARRTVAVDAAGAAIGSIGLFVFALLVAQLMQSHRAWMVMIVSTGGWVATSLLFWQIRKRM
jgi:hypothetical protein